jgi:hypothetical protein
MAVAKSCPDIVNDALLTKIATATAMHVCAATGGNNPTTRAQVLSSSLANSPMTVGLGNGDYTAADDAVSPYGRKVTMTAKNGLTVTGTGTQNAEIVCLIDGTDIIYITTCTLQALTNGNTVNVPAWKIQNGDPT